MDYLEIQSTSFPEQKEHFNGILDCHSKKLWHQLGLKLNEIIKVDFFKSGDHLLRLHDNAIEKVWKNINQQTYAWFTIAAARQSKDAAAALEFLEKIAEKVKDDAQASLLCKTEMARLKIELGAIPEARTLLDAGAKSLKDFPGIVANTIQAHMHRASFEYYKVKGPPSEYFRNCLLFLTYTPLETMSLDDQIILAADVSLAAIVGEGIYNFGELLQHPIVMKLHGTPQQWLSELLFAFNRGDITTFRKIFSAQAAGEPSLQRSQAFLEQKIKIMALIEMVFNKDAKERTIHFAEIAKTCDCEDDQVELILMKAFSLGVLKGLMDQCESNVRIKWVQPRVLDNEQLASIRDRLETWSKQVAGAAHFMESSAPELLGAH